MSQQHWQNIYNTKQDNQVSWTQDNPTTPLDYLQKLGLDKTANIIDIGGGASKFVDLLLDNGYTNITVLDISEAALARSKNRLGERASHVTWIVNDILDFNPIDQYDFWYDRAVFHFLTTEKDISSYVKKVNDNISRNGHFLLGTFSIDGPLKCSGLEIQRYSEQSMRQTFQDAFIAETCFMEMHLTPFDTIQEFQFCGFVRQILKQDSSAPF